MIANNAILRKFLTPKNLSEEGFQLFSCLSTQFYNSYNHTLYTIVYKSPSDSLYNCIMLLGYDTRLTIMLTIELLANYTLYT